MNKNRYSKMKTEKLLEFQAIYIPLSWIAVALCVAIIVFVDCGVLFKLIYAALAICTVLSMKSVKKQVESELENREYSEIDKQNAAKKVKKKTIILLALLVVCLFMQKCDYTSSSSSRGSSSSSRSEKGYWGSDGYYHSTEAEKRQAMKEAQEWMAKNW